MSQCVYVNRETNRNQRVPEYAVHLNIYSISNINNMKISCSFFFMAIFYLWFQNGAIVMPSNLENLARGKPSKSESQGKDHIKSTESYINEGKKFVEDRLGNPANENVARNIVMFLGDGMSVTTMAISRLDAGGVERTFSFEKFPFLGMAKTYCVDSQVADSACSATGKFLILLLNNIQ